MRILNLSPMLVMVLACQFTFTTFADEGQSVDDLSPSQGHGIYSQIYKNSKSIPQSMALFDQNYLKASNVDDGDRDNNGDQFGSAVAIDGDTLVIGAALEDGINDDNFNAGAAYVFVKTNGTWQEQAYITPPNTVSEFGNAVAISGNTIVIGASLEDTSGAAYIYTRTANTWTHRKTLKAISPVPGSGDLFGFSVDIDGNTVVVGSPKEDGADDNTEIDAGAAYVFTGSGSLWTQQDYLQADNLDSGDNFGVSVSLSNDTIVVGANREDGDNSGNQTDVGAAYVFVRSGTTWALQQYLEASNAQAKDNFGTSVAISNNSVVVGSFLEDGLDNGSQDNSGAAYVYLRNGTSWSEQTILRSTVIGTDNQFGNAVAIDGNSILIGANFEGSLSGAAYFFTQSQGSWTQQSMLKANNSDDFDEFGFAVALSGNNLVLTAPGEDSAFVGDPNDNTFDATGAGAAYVFSPSDFLFSDGFEDIVGPL